MAELLSNWPLYGLRLGTPRCELRLPTLAELDQLGKVAAEGIHDPAVMPFSDPWTEVEPAQLARGVLQWHWRQLADWKPEAWSLHLVVFADNKVVGIQDITAKQFGTVREVETGSWLGQRWHGQGLGTEMRAAILHLSFVGLGTEYATSSAFVDNPASLGVSRKLGYQPDGIERCEVRGAAQTSQRLRLSRADWEKHRTIDVQIEGLDACRDMFGLAPATDN